MSHHFWLNLHLIEFFARVDTNNAPNHLRHDNHVAQMGLDEIRLLIRLSLLFRLAELLDEAHGLALQAAVEPTAGTSVHDIAQLIGGEV